MKYSKVWEAIHDCLLNSNPVVLLLILESNGSSPGRKGFKMAVAPDKLVGSIGGGIMEHKFVELAREKIRSSDLTPLLKFQEHTKSNPNNQSGMICSGNSTLLVYPVVDSNYHAVLEILQHQASEDQAFIRINERGIQLIRQSDSLFQEPDYSDLSRASWQYTESTSFEHVIHIVGGGHVSLALSKLMADLKFRVVVYDDREGLNTLDQNTFAVEKRIVDYSTIAQQLMPDQDAYIVIMTFGYRSDKIVLRELIHADFKYLGVLGSAKKIDQLWTELSAEGIDPAKLNAVHAPVGLPIQSQTPEEIAVSIAAEIIQIKNFQ
jgi:xanthine dehydrogenase accessory factor